MSVLASCKHNDNSSKTSNAKPVIDNKKGIVIEKKDTVNLENTMSKITKPIVSCYIRIIKPVLKNESANSKEYKSAGNKTIPKMEDTLKLKNMNVFSNENPNVSCYEMVLISPNHSLSENVNANSTQVFDMVEQMPTFPGGTR